MSSLRQLGSGLLYALVSVVLVVGGLSLALAEGSPNTTPPEIPPTATLLVPSVSPSDTAMPSGVTEPSAPSATPQPAIVVTATPIPPLATTYTYVYPTVRPTSTRLTYSTPFPCGAYPGWVLAYTVKPGDTLFHISTLYRTTVNALQIANCKPTTVIYPGDRLWVPNVPTVTPGVTVIPTFPSATLVPTEPLTLTPLPYYTETAAPTDTPQP